jgi:hypothetical protein
MAIGKPVEAQGGGNYNRGPHAAFIGMNMSVGAIHLQRVSEKQEDGSWEKHPKRTYESVSGVILDDNFAVVKGISKAQDYSVESNTIHGSNQDLFIYEKKAQWGEGGQKTWGAKNLVCPPGQWKKEWKAEAARLTGNVARLNKVIFILVDKLDGKYVQSKDGKMAMFIAKLTLKGGAYKSYIELINKCKQNGGHNRLDSLDGFHLSFNGMQPREGGNFSPIFSAYNLGEKKEKTPFEQGMWAIAVRRTEGEIYPYIDYVKENNDAEPAASAPVAQSPAAEPAFHPPIQRTEERQAAPSTPPPVSNNPPAPTEAGEGDDLPF